MARSSRCCSSADRPALDGQSMLSTVAIHTARSSRGIAGALSRADRAGVAWARADAAAPSRKVRTTARRVMRYVMREARREQGTRGAEVSAPRRLYSDRDRTILTHRRKPEHAPIDVQIP